MCNALYPHKYRDRVTRKWYRRFVVLRDISAYLVCWHHPYQLSYDYTLLFCVCIFFLFLLKHSAGSFLFSINPNMSPYFLIFYCSNYSRIIFAMWPFGNWEDSNRKKKNKHRTIHAISECGNNENRLLYLPPAPPTPHLPLPIKQHIYPISHCID